MAGEYVKRRLFTLYDPSGHPVTCRVVLQPEQLNVMSPEQVAAHVVRKAMTFYDIDSPKSLTIRDTKDLEDDDIERGNC